jgi:N-acyl-D-aspartate/D-glutamate deacylase
MNLRIIKTGNEGSELVPERISVVDNDTHTIHYSFSRRDLEPAAWEWLDNVARFKYNTQQFIGPLVSVLSKANGQAVLISILEVFAAAATWHKAVRSTLTYLSPDLIDAILDAAR